MSVVNMSSGPKYDMAYLQNLLGEHFFGGNVLKKGSGSQGVFARQNWTDRYFVWNFGKDVQPSIAYYENKSHHSNGSAPKGAMRITKTASADVDYDAGRDTKVGKYRHKIGLRVHCFDGRDGKEREYNLLFDDAESAHNWKEAIEYVVSTLRSYLEEQLELSKSTRNLLGGGRERTVSESVVRGQYHNPNKTEMSFFHSPSSLSNHERRLQSQRQRVEEMQRQRLENLQAAPSVENESTETIEHSDVSSASTNPPNSVGNSDQKPKFLRRKEARQSTMLTAPTFGTTESLDPRSTIPSTKLHAAKLNVHAVKQHSRALVRKLDVDDSANEGATVEAGLTKSEDNILHVVRTAIEMKRTMYGHTIRDTVSLFNNMDKGHKGYLKATDIIAGLHRLGLGLSDSQVHQLMSHMHFDAHFERGLIRYDELSRAMHGHRKFVTAKGKLSSTTHSRYAEKVGYEHHGNKPGPEPSNPGKGSKTAMLKHAAGWNSGTSVRDRGSFDNSHDVERIRKLGKSEKPKSKLSGAVRLEPSSPPVQRAELVLNNRNETDHDDILEDLYGSPPLQQTHHSPAHSEQVLPTTIKKCHEEILALREALDVLGSAESDMSPASDFIRGSSPTFANTKNASSSKLSSRLSKANRTVAQLEERVEKLLAERHTLLELNEQLGGHDQAKHLSGQMKAQEMHYTKLIAEKNLELSKIREENIMIKREMTHLKLNTQNELEHAEAQVDMHKRKLKAHTRSSPPKREAWNSNTKQPEPRGRTMERQERKNVARHVKAGRKTETSPERRHYEQFAQFQRDAYPQDSSFKSQSSYVDNELAVDRDYRGDTRENDGFTSYDANILHVVRMAIDAKRSMYGHTINDTISLFEAMDRNRKGYLVVADVIDGLHRLDLGLSTNEIHQLMSYMHFNEHSELGQIQYREMARALHGHRHFVSAKNKAVHSTSTHSHIADKLSTEPVRATATYKRPPAVSQAHQKQIRSKLRAAAYTSKGINWKKLFQFYDRDNSGNIGELEFKRLLRSDAKLSKTMLSDADIKDLFNAVDVDGSGEIDFREFHAWVGDLPGSGNEATKHDASNFLYGSRDEERTNVSRVDESPSPPPLLDKSDRASDQVDSFRRMAEARQARGKEAQRRLELSRVASRHQDDLIVSARLGLGSVQGERRAFIPVINDPGVKKKRRKPPPLPSSVSPARAQQPVKSEAPSFMQSTASSKNHQLGGQPRTLMAEGDYAMVRSR
jgi:Ca2+-binding EF-hand superfamily protein